MNGTLKGKLSMLLELSKIDYNDLTTRQQENFNFTKISAVLAEYGYSTIRLTDDWQCADFIAQHIDGVTFLKVQLKGRAAFYKKYSGKDIHIAFPDAPDWYLYPHDEVLEQVLAQTKMGTTDSWNKKGGYSYSKLSKQMTAILEPYRIGQPAVDRTD